MAAVLLTVLKIAGISLLAIVVLVLLILLAVLFVPVGYRAGGNYFSRSDYKADIRAAWLLHTVSLIVDYCSGQARHVRIKLFGITVYDNFKPGGRKTRNKKKHKKNDNLEAGAERAGGNYKKTERCVKEYADVMDVTNDTDVTDTIDVIEAGTEKAKPKIFQKIQDFFIKIVKVFKNIKFTFKKICGTIVRTKDSIKYYIEIWRLDSTQKAVALCREHLVRVWREIRPRKLRLDLHLGFEDPSMTGEALAVWGMLYPVHLGTVDIRPEFDRNVFEGSCAMRGRFRMYVLIKAAIILYRDKNLRVLIKNIKRKTA